MLAAMTVTASVTTRKSVAVQPRFRGRGGKTGGSCSSSAIGASATSWAREAGADLCLTKPCLPSQVGRVVRAMLWRRELVRSTA